MDQGIHQECPFRGHCWGREIKDLDYVIMMKIDKIRDMLKHLPHGSGIDMIWELQIKDGVIYAYNSFHAMDEVGMYCGWLDFSLIIENPNAWKLKFGENSIDCYTTDEDNNIVDDSDYTTESIKEYLCDLFSEYLSNFLEGDV